MDRLKRPRKVYTREYKLEAVRLTTAGGRGTAQVARDLGINENTLHNWRDDAFFLIGRSSDGTLSMRSLARVG